MATLVWLELRAVWRASARWFLLGTVFWAIIIGIEEPDFLVHDAGAPAWPSLTAWLWVISVIELLTWSRVARTETIPLVLRWSGPARRIAVGTWAAWATALIAQACGALLTYAATKLLVSGAVQGATLLRVGASCALQAAAFASAALAIACLARDLASQLAVWAGLFAVSLATGVPWPLPLAWREILDPGAPVARLVVAAAATTAAGLVLSCDGLRRSMSRKERTAC
ncbi:MAG: hypothetical protein IPM29_32035 [Planctomycetes bacterium]|nr:hypothetical protein [Planctomycetota bacterium]